MNDVKAQKAKEKLVTIRSRSRENPKFDHFTLLFCRGRQRNVPKCFFLWSSFFARRWKTITLVFLGLIFKTSTIHSKITCYNFANLFAIVIVWLNHQHTKENLICSPFGKIKGSDNVFWNEDGKSLMYRFKSKGLRIRPCVKWSCLITNLYGANRVGVKTLINLKKFPPTLICNIL